MVVILKEVIPNANILSHNEPEYKYPKLQISLIQIARISMIPNSYNLPNTSGITTIGDECNVALTYFSDHCFELLVFGMCAFGMDS
jgi:hypothetical protein